MSRLIDRTLTLNCSQLSIMSEETSSDGNNWEEITSRYDTMTDDTNGIFIILVLRTVESLRHHKEHTMTLYGGGMKKT